MVKAPEGAEAAIEDRICELLYLLACEIAKHDQPQKTAAEWCSALIALVDALAFMMAQNWRIPPSPPTEH